MVRRRKIPLRTARAMVRAGLPVSRSELRGNQRRRTRPHYYVGGLSSLGAKGEERFQQRIFNQIKKSVEAENVSYGELATLASIAKSHPKLFMGEPRMAEVAGMSEARFRMLRGNQTPLERLRYHVSGAIARGEKQGIVGHPKGKVVKVLGQSVRAGSKRYYMLMEQKRNFDDLGRSELRGNPFDPPSQNELLRLKRADARGYAFTKKFSSKQPQALDMLISKLSMLKGNRDENLVTFLIRKRAKYPRDYIVILKHRKYVDGARVYSAGLKAEGAIGQFATILGAKAKRVGQSDYVFTTYGIRFPEERRKSSPGKLFGNRKR